MNKLKVFLEMIKFEHTIFALPFAFMGAVLGGVADLQQFPSWAQIGWIVLALIGARTAAMGLNRVIDKAIDAKNPRTALRAIPAGLLSSGQVIVYIIISFAVLIFAAYQLNPLCVILLPVAVFMLVLYSYTKRFTWGCHIFLGLTQGLAVLGGWIAVTGAFSWSSLVLYVTVAFWTAGFDIIYACQDADYDREEGLHSIPSRFGIARALVIARLFHVVTAVGLLVLMFMANLGWLYLIGVLVAYAILYYEHSIVKPHDLSRLNMAFFTMNGVLSIVVFAFTFLDLVVFSS